MTHVFGCSDNLEANINARSPFQIQMHDGALHLIHQHLRLQLMSVQKRFFCAFYNIFQAKVGYENVSDIPVCIQETVLVWCEDLTTRPRVVVWRIAHGGRMLRQ